MAGVSTGKRRCAPSFRAACNPRHCRPGAPGRQIIPFGSPLPPPCPFRRGFGAGLSDLDKTIEDRPAVLASLRAAAAIRNRTQGQRNGEAVRSEPMTVKGWPCRGDAAGLFISVAAARPDDAKDTRTRPNSMAPTASRGLRVSLRRRRGGRLRVAILHRAMPARSGV